MICHLEQRRPAENRQRFHAVEVGRDLFGHWQLCRRWRRIGTGGRGVMTSFAAQDEAERAAQQLIRVKTQRGYGAVGQGA